MFISMKRTQLLQNPALQKPIAPGLLTREELALALRKSPRTITEWTRTRKIPYVKVGSTGQADVLFDLNEVIAALKDKYGVKQAA